MYNLSSGIGYLINLTPKTQFIHSVTNISLHLKYPASSNTTVGFHINLRIRALQFTRSVDITIPHPTGARALQLIH